MSTITDSGAQPVVADTHAHLYDCYDLAGALARLAGNLHALNPDGHRLAFLTEAAGTDFFRRLADRDRPKPAGLACRPDRQPGVLEVAVDGGPAFRLFAGRQIVPAERIEILALTLSEPLEDGLPARETAHRVLAAGGVPVLSWAPGKWLGRRGKLVAALLDEFGTRLAVGDTTLRPVGWGEPRRMRWARRRGGVVLAGSDPLPRRGEERLLGGYASRWEGGFDPDDPLGSARRLLRGGQFPRTVGRRSSPMAVFRRLAVHMAARSRPSAGPCKT